MSGNIAKSFAKQKLVYWAPIVSGSGTLYEQPVVFKGAYIGNAQIGNGSPSDVVFAGGSTRENMVLFYLTKPLVDGYVCWDKTLADLEAEGISTIPPDQIEGTYKIRAVVDYVMPGATSATLSNMAFIASVL